MLMRFYINLSQQVVLELCVGEIKRFYRVLLPARLVNGQMK